MDLQREIPIAPTEKKKTKKKQKKQKLKQKKSNKQTNLNNIVHLMSDPEGNS